MILVDSNIPMYLVGSAHPHKVAAEHILTDLIARGGKLVADVEVFPEILHRYAAIGRLDAIQPAFDTLLAIVDEVFPIDLEDAKRAKTIVMGGYGLSARDAIHVSVMERHGIRRLISFDRGFDRFPGIERIPGPSVV